MPNPFITVSLEDTAAFSDELTKDAQKQEEHYLKGYTSDDPAIVETNKLQDNAEQFVDASIDATEQVLSGEVATESADEENPFIPKAAPTTDEPLAVPVESETNPFEGTVAEEATEGSEQNPFFATSAGEAPTEVDVDGDSKPDLTASVDSLESIIEDLEEVMTENQPNARSTEFLVDVHLEDDGKQLLDQDLDAAIAQAPETLESLESIKLCDERSVSQILTILRSKVEEIKPV